VIGAEQSFRRVTGEEVGQRLEERLGRRRPRFACVIASTDTALVPGISAAGASTELIAYTAAADAEYITWGAARCLPGVPQNPLGPPGPALITRAALELANIPALILDAGCRIRPDCPTVDLGGGPGGLISEGRAVPRADELFQVGQTYGHKLASTDEYLVLGESVPGGTTTALALLLALGIAADGRVSSSLAGNAHPRKSQLAHEALLHLASGEVERDPLAAVAILGDPMQAAVAGLVTGVLEQNGLVLLAGGTQMIAVAALLHRLVRSGKCSTMDGRVGVATTRWVVEDPTADAMGLLHEAAPEVPLFATQLSFAHSRHALLRRYEEGLVKEGVGAGGIAVAAALSAGIRCTQIQDRVAELYDKLPRGDQLTHG
jgi:uncharacterized protein (TIGR00303 family)